MELLSSCGMIFRAGSSDSPQSRTRNECSAEFAVSEIDKKASVGASEHRHLILARLPEDTCAQRAPWTPEARKLRTSVSPYRTCELSSEQLSIGELPGWSAAAENNFKLGRSVANDLNLLRVRYV